MSDTTNQGITFSQNYPPIIGCAHRLELNDVWQLLGKRRDNRPLEKRCFQRRTPSERLALRDEPHRGWRDSSGCLPSWVIELLPSPQRENDPRGHWRHPQLKTRLLVLIPHVASLPWQDTREVLDQFTRNPDADAELRAPAIRWFVHSDSSNAIPILKRHDSEQFRVLVPRLIDTDPSWMTQKTVCDHVQRRRQDLLTRFLGRTAYKGRFRTGNTRFVLPVISGFQQWTPSQLQTFRLTLEEITNDSYCDSPTLLQVIRQFSAIPDKLSLRLVELADATKPQ